jgi:hypothetical protein
MLGESTCSQTFAVVLCEELNGHGLRLAPDDGGIVTDTYTFKDVVPECTNISVGFANAHSDREWLDVVYLQRLRQAALAVDWESLPTCRALQHRCQLAS